MRLQDVMAAANSWAIFDPVMAALLGMLTGIGGGMVRDVLLAEIPLVLRADLYAVATLAGAAVLVMGSLLHPPLNRGDDRRGSAVLRTSLIAIQHGWHLPVARRRKQSKEADGEEIRDDQLGGR
jgi:uncharacterized membrane protein YeiH